MVCGARAMEKQIEHVIPNDTHTHKDPNSNFAELILHASAITPRKASAKAHTALSVMSMTKCNFA